MFGSTPSPCMFGLELRGLKEEERAYWIRLSNFLRLIEVFRVGQTETERRPEEEY